MIFPTHAIAVALSIKLDDSNLVLVNTVVCISPKKWVILSTFDLSL